jgi:LemA protein
MTPLAWLLIGIAVLLVISVIMSHNRFVRQRTLADESWGDIDVELSRRHDLIPNLVDTVQGYATHEREVLERLVRAREAAAAHREDGPHAREGFEDSVTLALQSVLARVEAYPDLKASSNFLDLQRQLTLTEDRIAAARRFYNGNVRSYNTRVQTFPSNLVAAAFGFKRKDFFELQDAASAPSEPSR